jgi:hypothetical protein
VWVLFVVAAREIKGWSEQGASCAGDVASSVSGK